MENLTDIPTAELLQRAERNAFEKGIARAGFLLSLILPPIVWFFIFHYMDHKLLPGLLLCLLASIMIPVTLCALTKFLSEWREHSLIKELARRFGLWSMPQYTRYYRDQLQPGEFRCVFQARLLPGGRRYWACLILDSRGIMKFKQTYCPGSFSVFTTPSWSELTTAEINLTPRQIATIQTLIHDSKAWGNQKIQSEIRVKDGCPAALAIITGDGTEPIEIKYNLGLVPNVTKPVDPRLELLKEIANLVGLGSFPQIPYEALQTKTIS